MKKYCLAFIFLLLALLSCEKKEELSESYLVVEGWIENGDFPVVMVSETIGISSGTLISPKDMIEHVGKWAKVSVNDGEKTVVLTGMADSRYFPPYIFTTNSIRGETGKTYTLEVEYKDYKATAQTTIPRPVPIDTLYIREVAKDSTCILMCGFSDPQQEENFYRIVAMSKGEDSNYHSCTLTTTTDAVMEGYSEIPVFNITRLLGYGSKPNIKLGEEIWMKLYTMDEASFNYWSDFELMKDYNMVGLNMKFSSIRRNVDGALGYWNGYGVDGEKSILVTDEEHFPTAAQE